MTRGERPRSNEWTEAHEEGAIQCGGLSHKSTWPYVQRCDELATVKTVNDDWFCAKHADVESYLDGTQVYSVGRVKVLEVTTEKYRIYVDNRVQATRKTMKGAMRFAHRLTKENQ